MSIDGSDIQVPCTVTWVTQEDERVCPICGALDGKQWIIQDIEESILYDESFGPVYDLDNDVSLAHSSYGRRDTCRCFLEVEADLDTPVQAILQSYRGGNNLTDIQEFRRNLREVKAEMGELRWQIVELNLVLTRLESLSRKLNLPPEIQAQIQQIQKLQAVMLGLLNTAILLEAASGPIGWFLAGTSVLMTATSIGEFASEPLYPAETISPTQRGLE